MLLAAEPAPLTDAATRDRLIAAAVKLFQRNGYHAVGVAAILAETKLPKGCFYHHFPGGKTELAAAAADWLGNEIVDAMERARAKSVGAAQFLARAARDTAEWLEKRDFAEGSLLMMLADEGVPHEPVIAEAVSRNVEAVGHALCRLIGEKGTDEAFTAASLMFAIYCGATGLARALQSTRPLLDVATLFERRDAETMFA
ncbi:helix-turn-helix domain-containing protein [Parasphingopyxis sp.]|uniref:TetR/AcrR family transcriptional regulator n=1 Tax=Parasphingopyxis sp. TaxID=1920299 RepID=UPI0032ED5DA8